MKIVYCDQGDQNWFQCRAGVITASMFYVARKRVGELTPQQLIYVAACRRGESIKAAAELAGYKAVPRSESIERALAGEVVGDWSDAAKDYAFRLAVERISHMPLDEGFETWSMRRGHELEPQARMEHEAQTGLIVERAGLVLTDDGLFGASADGLIDADGGSEYKCLVDPGRMRKLWLDHDISEFTDQVQGCLWLTGRKWWHFCMYSPALEAIGKQLYFCEVRRDEEYIFNLEQDLVRFERLVSQYEADLRSNTAGLYLEQVATLEPANHTEEAKQIEREIARTEAVLTAAQEHRKTEPQAAWPFPPQGSALTAVAPAPAPIDTGEMIKIGELNALLGFVVTADFLERLGFKCTLGQTRNCKQYPASQLPAIYARLIGHIQALAAEPYRAAA